MGQGKSELFELLVGLSEPSSSKRGPNGLKLNLN